VRNRPSGGAGLDAATCSASAALAPRSVVEYLNEDIFVPAKIGLNHRLTGLLWAAFAALFITCVAASGAKAADKMDGLPVRNTGQYAVLDTDRGVIVIELYPAVAPKTVANFEKLSKDGFYNGLTFHPERRSSGSQFYICLAPAPFLNGQYTIFGGVVEGMGVVDKIRVGDHIKKVTITDKLPQ
jgi:peptidyl-prolyl cis-trans isomerase B (cyclophilin B)